MKSSLMIKLLTILLLFAMLPITGCAGTDDVKSLADAGNRAAGGAADTATGSKQIDLKAQVTQAGDNQQEAWRVDIQRNTSNTTAGSTYAAVSYAAGGGAAALERAIATDPLVKSLQAEIAAIEASTVEPRPTERLDALRAALGARLEKVSEALARAPAPAEIHDVYQVVLAPSALGKDQPSVTEWDAKAAAEIQSVIAAAKGATSRPSQ